jgi:hypothetical protein
LRLCGLRDCSGDALPSAQRANADISLACIVIVDEA